jgi:conjugative relaxase-like TrwC/TraI family protein
VTGFDLTFSAPKSVSALWALGDASRAAQAMAAYRAAVRRPVLSGRPCGAVPARDGRVEQVGSEGLVAAVFDHRSSRAGDPQLHTDALVLNRSAAPTAGGAPFMPLSGTTTRRTPG